MQDSTISPCFESPCSCEPSKSLACKQSDDFEDSHLLSPARQNTGNTDVAGGDIEGNKSCNNLKQIENHDYNLDDNPNQNSFDRLRNQGDYLRDCSVVARNLNENLIQNQELKSKEPNILVKIGQQTLGIYLWQKLLLELLLPRMVGDSIQMPMGVYNWVLTPVVATVMLVVCYGVTMGAGACYKFKDNAYLGR